MSVLPQLALKLLIALAGMASLVTLFRLFEKHIDGRPLLEYEPRRAVPWNALAPLLLLSPLGFALWSALHAEPTGDPALEAAMLTSVAAARAIGAPPAAALGDSATLTPALEMARRASGAGSEAAGIWAQAATTLLLAAGGAMLFHLAFGATAADIGLPSDWNQVRRDVKIGVVAWVASLAPIYAVLILLNEVFQPTEGHPLVEELMTNPSWPMLSAAAFTAVIAAPIYEELAFRVTFQGWLERRGMIAGRGVATPLSLSDGVCASGRLGSAEEAATTTPLTGFVDSPPGWAPLLTSSVLFGLAHYGHGVSPAPLILLGVVLGYVYRQTHRLLPCVVCHLMFNGFTFIMLGLTFAGAG